MSSPMPDLGPNAGLVEELFRKFQENPDSIAPAWQEFFADYQPRHVSAAPVASAAAPAQESAASAPAPRRPAINTLAGETPTPITGPSKAIVTNMEASLAVPTATSVRTIPAKLLEVNRQIVNNHLARTRGGKVSFTHLIAFAVLRALRAVPNMNSSYGLVEDKPSVVRHSQVNLGLAIDQHRPDGSRSLVVPNLKAADTLDFAAFVAAYDDVVRRVKNNAITADDFAGTTVSLTNPGMIGTMHSVPRLMPGQGVIVGVGSIDFPPEYLGADVGTLARIGVSKVVTITSTYDHRVIQGAESGEFLAAVQRCLLGDDGFYDDIFQSLAVPYEPARWVPDTQNLDDTMALAEKAIHVQQLINMYRVRGHLIANLDPLGRTEPRTHPELDINHWGLSIWDLDREFPTGGLAGRRSMLLRDIMSTLRDAYSRTIAVEYMYIQEADEKAWIQERVECRPEPLTFDDKQQILRSLNAAEAFERFLHTKYLGQKRFSLEGAETLIPMVEFLLDAAADAGIGEVVVGMAHRGRLNALANIIGKSYGQIFREFEGELDPNVPQGSGDVKYHLGASGTHTTRDGRELVVSMAANPSHLETVDPVVEGIVRAKQDLVVRPTGSPQEAIGADSFPYLAVLIHGDAAFAGQGVVFETLNLSQLSGYHVGGAIHIVINNQVGFTTAPESARSSFYPTDVAKTIQAPVLHVNGDDPEACARAAKLAFDFRERFHRDVVIDVVCYRRHGHNEGDDPSYTQPQMYSLIDQMRSVRKIYTETLVRRGDISLEAAEASLTEFNARLQQVLDEVRTIPKPTLSGAPVNEIPSDPPAPETGAPEDVLRRIATVTASAPEGFTIHPKLERQFEQRAQLLAEGDVDWALGEAMAFGSLLVEGTNVRLMGQDSRRGTFSHRHAALVDYVNGADYVPLSNLDTQAFFTVRDSLLSEYAALGFEYGYSVEARDALVAWEAQFGDFVNGAEIIIDNFLVAAEDKWGQTCNLVMLLPHGYEGQGPEHSSGRIERFLSLCARNNMRVAQPTSAAQYFHLLRAQVRRERPTPLVVFTPKSMLRATQTRSPLSDFTSGRFETVLADAGADASKVTRLVLASGKVGHEALARRDEIGASTVAVARVEQLYPVPADDLLAVASRYPNLTEVVWLQEEPENMGAWPFLQPRLRTLFAQRDVRVVARAESASPATGSGLVHAAEQADILQRSIG